MSVRHNYLSHSAPILCGIYCSTSIKFSHCRRQLVNWFYSTMDSFQDNGPRYEPLPRWGHASVTIGTKVYMWGGRIEDFSETSKQELAQAIEVFDLSTETWEQKTTYGTPPCGLYNNAHAAIGNSLYVYGGWDGQCAYDTLHELNLTTMTWRELIASNPSENPMKMSGCAMVPYGDHKLVLFGGYGAPSESQQPGSTFFRRHGISDKKGWTNELRVFDLHEGTWSSPATMGSRPPPCVDFSLTKVDSHRAVVFGGYQPETGTVADTYILNIDTWHWNKLTEGADSGNMWPEARDGHTACLLAGAPQPKLLVTGGWNTSDKALSDAWTLDVNSGTWKEFSLPSDVGCRFWHTMVSIPCTLRLKQLLFFGGCPGAPELGESWPKLAATIILELGHMSFPLPGEGGEEWVVLDVVAGGGLGQPMRRMKEKVLFAEYRAARAEEVAREVVGKLQVASIRTIRTPTPESDVFIQKEEQPFWIIPREDIQLTGEELGRGKWSVVQVAMYRGVRVAARCLFSQIISEDNRKVFIECLNTAAKLRHPNLLPFIGAILDGEPIIVTELMHSNLKLIVERNALAYHQVISIAFDIAKALHFLHTTKPDPVVHGELTSTSILLEPIRGNKWRAKLSDFMTARFFQQLVMSSSLMDDRTSPLFFPKPTSPPPVISPTARSQSATPPPMGAMGRKISISAPEPFDPTDISPKRDVYSYGILLVEMSTQSSPLEVSLAYLLESVSWTNISTLIKRCIDPIPEKRPTMEEIASDLEEFNRSLFAAHSPKV